MFIKVNIKAAGTAIININHIVSMWPQADGTMVIETINDVGTDALSSSETEVSINTKIKKVKNGMGWA